MKNCVKKLEDKKSLYIASFLTICNSFLTVCIAFLLEMLVNTANQGNLKELVKDFAVIGVYLVIAFFITKFTSVCSNKYIVKQNLALRSFLLSNFFTKVCR